MYNDCFYQEDERGFGLDISEVQGIDGEKSTLVISKIIVGSPADRCGQLQTGDQLISIDGQKVLGYSCVKVSQLEVCVVAVSYKHFACIGKMSAAKGSISW